MNPTLTQLANELRDAILRWKGQGLIRQAELAPKSRAIDLSIVQRRREHRLAYRREWMRRRRQCQNSSDSSNPPKS